MDGENKVLKACQIATLFTENECVALLIVVTQTYLPLT
jgi:hypothetical protein